MQKLPDHFVGKDFPVSLSTKGGIATETWDLTGQVLANLSGLGIEHLIAKAARWYTMPTVAQVSVTKSAIRSPILIALADRLGKSQAA